MTGKLRPAVKALIEKDGEILVLRTETEDSSYWVLPGGKVEYGEEPVEALERELQEEISCEADIGETVGMYHFFTGAEDDGEQIVLTVFEVDIEGKEIDISDNPADENITEYRWMKPQELVRKSNNESLCDLIESYTSDLPKLVRNNIPSIIRKNEGYPPNTASPEDYPNHDFYREKIVEEADEVLEAETRDEQIEELADLKQALEAYSEQENIDSGHVEQLRKQKKAERGGFSEDIVLENSRESEKN